MSIPATDAQRFNCSLRHTELVARRGDSDIADVVYGDSQVRDPRGSRGC
jgi:hypothetical protein